MLPIISLAGFYHVQVLLLPVVATVVTVVPATNATTATATEYCQFSTSSCCDCKLLVFAPLLVPVLLLKHSFATPTRNTMANTAAAHTMPPRTVGNTEVLSSGRKLH